MSQRINYYKASPAAFRAILHMEEEAKKLGIEPSLYELIKIRASQINGCAYCINMHTRDARKAGETEQRLYLLSAWRETKLFSEKERAALAWTEAVTEISKEGVSDSLFQEMKAHFSDEEIVNINLLVIAINAWNRMGVAFQSELD